MNSINLIIMSFLYTLLTFFGCKEIKTRPEKITDYDTIKSLTLYQYLESKPEVLIKTIDGNTANLMQYKGKKVLIVNTASKCGYTPQYSELEKLNQEYGDKIVVLGFPSNDFGSQEPGTNDEIKNFCKINYNITFPMFEKISVTGSSKHAIYKWLTEKELNGWNDTEPKWNFNKYLLDEEGNLIKYFSSQVKPLSSEIIELLN